MRALAEKGSWNPRPGSSSILVTVTGIQVLRNTIFCPDRTKGQRRPRESRKEWQVAGLGGRADRGPRVWTLAASTVT